jgi:hypothetical protein
VSGHRSIPDSLLDPCSEGTLSISRASLRGTKCSAQKDSQPPGLGRKDRSLHTMCCSLSPFLVWLCITPVKYKHPFCTTT